MEWIIGILLAGIASAIVCWIVCGPHAVEDPDETLPFELPADMPVNWIEVELVGGGGDGSKHHVPANTREMAFQCQCCNHKQFYVRRGNKMIFAAYTDEYGRHETGLLEDIRNN